MQAPEVTSCIQVTPCFHCTWGNFSFPLLARKLIGSPCSNGFKLGDLKSVEGCLCQVTSGGVRLFTDRPTPFHIPGGKRRPADLCRPGPFYPEARNTGVPGLLAFLKIFPATAAQLQTAPAHPGAPVKVHLFFCLPKRVTRKQLALPWTLHQSPANTHHLQLSHLLQYPLPWVCPGSSVGVIFVLHIGHVEERGILSLQCGFEELAS